MRIFSYRCDLCGGNLCQEDGERGMRCLMCSRLRPFRVRVFHTRGRLALPTLLLFRINGAKRLYSRAHR